MRILLNTSAFALACVLAAPAVPAFAQARMQPAPSTAPAPAPAPQPSPAPMQPQGQPPQAEAPMKQIPLADKQIEGALSANVELSPVLDKLPENAEPDAKTIAQLDGIAKKHGFASYADYDLVTSNINLVLAGFDMESKKYIGPEAVLKNDIAAVQADKQMSPADKKAALTELNDSLKTITPLQFPGNVAVVTKYFDKLAAAMQDKQ